MIGASTLPVVSVIMSALNAERTIEGAISSVLWQTLAEWELIVIDDGSSDSTRAKIEAIVDPRIRLMPRNDRRGLAARLNEAVAHSRGRYIARMDADDVAYPDRLQTQLKYMIGHPDVDLVGAAVMAFRDPNIPIGVTKVQERHEDICARPEAGFLLAHPTWLGRAQFFKSFPYDESALRAQDQDLLLRSYMTARFANVPRILLGYRQERVTAKNNLVGRLQYCKRQIDVWGRERQYRRLARGLATQAIRGALAAPLLAFGLGPLVVARRYAEASPSEISTWTSIARRLS
jgi:glycosyltransferase involved in cell wall biosynthesis